MNASDKRRPIMSRLNASYGEQVSKSGYLNAEELMKTIAKSFGQSTLAGVGLFVALTVLGDFDSWYIGPHKAEIATFVALILGPLRAAMIGRKYLEVGNDDT